MHSQEVYENPESRLEYEAPSIEDLGSVSDLTLGTNIPGSGDAFLGIPAPGQLSGGV
ncbi:MAG: lasso RiPP family leader peptide-containing protein [Actinomycetota bacterium]|nr:lasso RiPP family leader peptide-containing protein [Actinomycetota bacterium]